LLQVLHQGGASEKAGGTIQRDQAGGWAAALTVPCAGTAPVHWLSEPATSPVAASDLISFLKALPDCRMRRGIRFPQWWMLLVAILSILSGQGSLVGMERFAKRHHQALNELLGTDFRKSPSDSTFRLLLAQLDVPGFETLLRDWMAAQPGVTETLDTLVCDGKTLRGSIAENENGAARYGLRPTAST
jgi:hypothetical protein